MLTSARCLLGAGQASSITYEPQGAVSFYYEEARNFYSENQYISLLTTQVLEAAITQSNAEFARRRFAAALGSESFNFGGFCPTSASLHPLGEISPVSQIPIAGPFYFSQYNLR